MPATARTPTTTGTASRCSSTTSAPSRTPSTPACPSDIVNHEFGHAVLDGIRPLFNESSNPQTAAFHEFMGDLTAILLTLKNSTLRQQLAEASGGKFEKATTLSSLAEEFGQAVKGRPYLRTALNTDTMGDDGERDEPAPAVRGADRRDVRCLDRARRALPGGQDEIGQTRRTEHEEVVLVRRRSHAAHGHPAARSAAAGRSDVPRLRPGRVPVAAACPIRSIRRTTTAC